MAMPKEGRLHAAKVLRYVSGLLENDQLDYLIVGYVDVTGPINFFVGDKTKLHSAVHIMSAIADNMALADMHQEGGMQ